MYKRILVPLDTSEVAEAAIPHAIALAKALDASVTLLTVIEPLRVYPDPGMVVPLVDVSFDVEAERENAHKYLHAIAERFKREGVLARTVIVEGDAAESICSYSAEHDVDLLVMSTHGRSGIRKIVYGSVAERILHDAKIPVLLIRPLPHH